jgi:DNA mismatch repair protein MutS
LDRFTIRNLELVYSPHDNAKTLLDVLDKTVSPMGGRLMHRWLILPLKDAGEIRHRHSIVKWLKNNPDQMDELGGLLKDIGDLERLIAKVAVGKINPRELAHLKRTMIRIPLIKNILEKNNTEKELVHIINKLNGCEELVAKINDILADEPAVQIGKGPIIKEGFDDELDELRAISGSGKNYLDQLQDRESLRTGISSLKISFNNVFGYYLEVRNTHKDKVPTDWIRKQTLTQAERYITQELKEYETKILGAEEKILSIEQRLFGDLVQRCLTYLVDLQYNSKVLAELDVLTTFACLAVSNGYTKPIIENSSSLEIQDGRHPVIEKLLPTGEQYIANDVMLDPENCQMMMITGPNMSGKSALLRQTAIITLMAQMGSYVPASFAKIGCVDRIFTRVGASDNLSAGESTFMVEMNETASILNQMTGRSLIVLDEIGRGTSTYDGISIAWAIAEFLHEHPIHRPKTLFATHYHELNEMTHRFPRIQNFNVAVKEEKGKVIFLRKLKTGGSNHSFGIHVAQLAGMPKMVIQRAKDMLKQLESQRGEDQQAQVIGASGQLSIFEMQDPQWNKVKNQIRHLDINQMTPMEALQFIAQLQKEAEND